MMTHLLWGPDAVKGTWVPGGLVGPKNVLRDLFFGRTLDPVPDGLYFTCHPDYPRSTGLIDYIGNTDRVHPVSPRLKDFLIGKGAAEWAQFVPVELHDATGACLARYHLLHVTHLVDCIDADRSDLLTSGVGGIIAVTELVLDEAKLAGGPPIQKIDELYELVVEEMLAAEISKAGFTGIEWLSVDEYV